MFDAEQFLTSFNKATSGVDRTMALAGISFLYGRATEHAEWRHAIAQVHSFVDKYIDRALTEQAEAKATAKKDGDEEPGKDVNGGVNMKLKSCPFSLVSKLVKETTDRKSLSYQLISLFPPAMRSSSVSVGYSSTWHGILTSGSQFVRRLWLHQGWSSR